MTTREQTAQEECYRLSPASGGLGLHCEAGGVSLGGVALLHRTGKGFAPRPVHEIEALIKGAYGQGRDLIRLTSGLRVAADALNRGDVSRAMIAAVHLRLPDLSDDGAALMARVDDILAKYSPDEPRDWRGRWTAGGTGSAPASADGHRPMPSGPAGQRRGPASVAQNSAANAGAGQPGGGPERSWDAPAHLFGGQLTPVAGGSNFPPEDEVTSDIPPPEPNINAPRVPQGWDQPGHVAGGLQYLSILRPTLPNGQPWPVATHDAIQKILSGMKKPEMVIYVPVGRAGPTLIGSDLEKDYEQPPGYSAVRLIGIPQVTRPIGRQSFHAYDSVDEAIILAESNQFGTIYFNRAWSTLTNREVQSRIRPDVVAVVRPGLNLGYVYHPVEVMSPGQKEEVLQGRMPEDLRIEPLDFRHFRSSSYHRSPYFTYFDTPRYET